MTSKLNILMVGISTPPKSGAESIQAGKYAEALSKHAQIHLLTTPATNKGWNKKDSFLLNYLKCFTTISVLQNHESSRLLNFFARFPIFQSIIFPDRSFLFPRLWKKAVKSTNQPDIIYSRGLPASSCLMGLKLKRFYKVPWILHLSDPWADNPYLGFKKGNYFRQKNLEKTCFEEADLVSFTSEKTRIHYEKVYPQLASRLMVFPNVLSKTQVLTTPAQNTSGFLTFLFTGNLYGARSGLFLIDAFSKVYKKDPQLLESVRLDLVGNIDGGIQDEMNAKSLPFLHLHGPVPYNQSLELQKSADCLISIDKPADHEIEKVFFPSKLLDYIAQKKFILAITNHDSTTHDFVEGNYGKCFSYDQKEDLIDYIETSLKIFHQGQQPFVGFEKIDGFFMADYQAKRLINKIEELCQK